MTPCRVVVFGVLPLGRRRKPAERGWFDWNPDRRMERQMARLRGAGSFCWPSHRAAWRRARVMLRAPVVRQVRVETIGGREVGRLWRNDDDSAPGGAGRPQA